MPDDWLVVVASDKLLGMSKRTKRARKVAGSGDAIKRPRSWEKAVHVAGLRLFGSTQSEAAKAAGVGERTVRAWESCSWWPEAIEAAQSTHVVERALALARKNLIQGLASGDTKLAMWTLERLDPQRFGPPRQTLEHSGPDGGPIQLSDEELATLTAAELAERYKDTTT